MIDIPMSAIGFPEKEFNEVYKNITSEKVDSLTDEQIQESKIAFIMISEGMTKIINIFKQEPTK